MLVVSDPARALVAPDAVDEVDAVLGGALDTFLRVAAHDEDLVEVGQYAIPAGRGPVERHRGVVGVLPVLAQLVLAMW